MDGAPETEPRWRLYCKDDSAPGQGVALRSTLAKVEASVERHDLAVSAMAYRHYHVGPSFNDDLDPFFHKRWGFRDEMEVRVLAYQAKHCLDLAFALSGGFGFAPPPPAPPELPEYIRVGWNALDVLEAIIVSPYATEEYEQRVRATVATHAPVANALVELSRFSERSSNPLF